MTHYGLQEEKYVSAGYKNKAVVFLSKNFKFMQINSQ